MSSATRVPITDDRSRSRRGLRVLLTTWPGIEGVGKASDGREAVRLVEETWPDAVLMDANMPATGGRTATRVIEERGPGIKVIALTMYGANKHDAMTAARMRS